MFQLFLVGVAGIVISGIFIGAWTVGHHQRASFYSETVQHRNYRKKITLYSGLSGAISLGIAGLMNYIVK